MVRIIGLCRKSDWVREHSSMLEDWSSDEDEGEGTTRWVQRTHGILMICDVQMLPAQDYKFAQDYKILS
jgi:hypothetical protein